jgi:hypothetical protein
MRINGLIFSLLVLLTGCYRQPVKIVPQTITDGRYDSEFPSRDAASELESITHSVYKLYSVASYKTFYFKQGVAVTKLDLLTGNYLYKSFGTTYSSETTSGTATAIYQAFNRFTFITCAHVLESPDTLITYFKPVKDDPDQFISSISIKEKQENFIKGFTGCGKVDILAIDRKNDVAIIGKECDKPGDLITTFMYSSGNAKELRWGNFVYIIGYPLGSLMITTGIVSNPRSDEYGSFMVDALFNKGFSGGIILALRDGVPNFELVGIIRSVPFQKEYYLKPEKEIFEMAYDENALYKGGLFVGTHEAIRYGVTTVIPMEMIRDLYQKNRLPLLSEGYNLDSFFK